MSSAINAIGSSAASNSGTTNAAAIASTDALGNTSTFLQLLVAQMKNQDPTQPTDPNAYISQMVDVNSLQQLIGINQGITSLDGSVGATSSGTSS